MSQNKQLTVEDLILLLLYQAPDIPIHGKEMLVKQVWVISQDLAKYLPMPIEDGKFTRHKTGPTSDYVRKVFDALRNNGLVEQYGYTRKGVSWSETITITKSGYERIRALVNTLSDEMKAILRDKRVGLDQLGRDGITYFVQVHWPEMTEGEPVHPNINDW